MSCYIVDDAVINIIVSACEHWRTGPNVWLLPCAPVTTPTDARSLGRRLLGLNCLAHSVRYPGRVDEDRRNRAGAFQYSSTLPPTIKQVYRALCEYLYQCSEGVRCEENRTFKAFEALHNRLAHLIARAAR